MKYNKATLVLALLACGLGFTACDDKNEYVPGAPAGEYNVGFGSQENLVLDFDQTELVVELSRAGTEGQLTVPVEGLVVPECMSLPKEATFADGSATASVTVAIGEDMKPFTDYQLSFRIPEKYTDAYAENGKSPIYSVTLKKEDYKVVAKGEYQASVLYEDSWEQPVEYSAMMDLYRLPDCFAKGTHWYFAFDGAEGFTFTTKDGEPVSKFLCGMVHSAYGAITANVLADNPVGYVQGGVQGAEGYFRFPLKYTVSAGSFGANYEYLFVLEWLEKPWEAAE